MTENELVVEEVRRALGERTNARGFRIFSGAARERAPLGEEEQLEQRGFSGAGRAGEKDEFALGDVEMNVTQHRGSPECDLVT